MKRIATLIVLFAFAKAIPAAAQTEFKAIAKYTSQTKMPIKADSAVQKKMAADPMYKQIMEQIQKGSTADYVMNFTATESYYKEEEKLATPGGANSDFSITISSSTSGSEIYKNLVTQQRIQQGDIMGKPFVIVDSLNTYTWELHNESKEIGGFTCFKATYTPEIEKDAEDHEEKEEKNQDETQEENTSIFSMVDSSFDPVITAWYTPDVQVSHGPGAYHGLPGLIVELQENNTIILLTSLEINPKEKLQIVKPNQGKKLSQEKFDELFKKKIEERQKKQSRSSGGTYFFRAG